MAGFDAALRHLREGVHDLLSPQKINALARRARGTFRERVLTPGVTLSLFAQQIARGNVSCSAVVHFAGEEFTDAAWCQARQRLSIELIEEVNQQIVHAAQEELARSDDAGDGTYRWRGHRLLLIDGTSDSMPDTPALREHYGVPQSSKPDLGFPAAHLMLLMDHRSGLLLDSHDTHVDTHDAAVASKVHGALREGDVVLGDDAFGTYAHLALLLRAKAHAIMPVHHKRHVDFTPGRKHVPMKDNCKTSSAGKPRSKLIKTLGEQDQIVEYCKPPRRPDWMTVEQWAQIPDSIQVRETRRVVKRHGFRPITVTIVSTLLDAKQYPADELIELRLTRWMVETNIRHLKITLGMAILKCKTVDGIRKERAMFLLVYNVLRLIMLQSARSQRVNVNRISFADALAWLRYGDVTLPPRLKVNPRRPGRLHPRAVKRNRSRFPFMTRPRAELQSQLEALHRDTA